MNKLLFVFIGVFLISFCSCQSQIQLLEATSQSYAGGRQEAASGIKYLVKFIVKQSSDQIFLDTFWVGDRYYPMTDIFIKNQKVEKFNSGDTITFYANQIKNNQQYTSDDYNKKECPQKTDAQAIIEYHTKKGIKFFAIDSIKELPIVARP